MSVASQSDHSVVLHNVPEEQSRRIMDAIGAYHPTHRYENETLELNGLLHGVSWQDYMQLLEALGDHSLRHTYDKGTLEMMAPRKDHDRPKALIGRIIHAISYAFDIDVHSVGSTTITSSAVDKGYEPDDAYYIANEQLVRHKKLFEPDVDPAPDLVIEIDVTHTSVPRLPAFAALGVTEVWRDDDQSLRFYKLGNDGKYHEIQQSIAFPFLTPADIERCLDQFGELSENTVLKNLIDAIRSRLAAPDTTTENNE